MKNCLTRFYIIAIFSLFFVEYNYGQTTFQKTFISTGLNAGSSVQQTADGGYIVAGRGYSNSTSSTDAFLLKVNSNGEETWGKSYGTPSYDWANYVKQTIDGGYIIEGFTQDQSGAIFLLKTDMNGDTSWVRRLNDGYYSSNFNQVEQTTDDGFVTAFAFYNGGTTAARIVKTDQNGNLLWEKQYGDSTTNVFPFSIHETSDHGFIIAGYAYSIFYYKNVVMIKTDDSGNVQWSKTYGNEWNDEIAFDAHQDYNGGYIIAGSMGQSSQNKNLAIRTNGTGDTLWTRLFSDLPSISYIDYSVLQTADEGFILAGTEYIFGEGTNKAHIMKLNSNGDTLWTRTFGTNGYNTTALSACSANDGGYCFAGSRGLSFSSIYQIYLLKTDSMGKSGCDEEHTYFTIDTNSIEVNSLSLPVSSVNLTSNSFHLTIGSSIDENILCNNAVIDPAESENLLISPNPFTNSTTITLLSQQKIPTIKLFDEIGREVLFTSQSSQQGNKTQLTIERGNLANGMYFLSINSKEKSEVVKVMIE